MNKEEVIKLIGKEKEKDFDKFMNGQTVGINGDGTIDYYYYNWDVEKFLSLIGKKKPQKENSAREE